MQTFEPPAELDASGADADKSVSSRLYWVIALALLIAGVPLIHLTAGAIAGLSTVDQLLEAAELWDDEFDPVIVRDGIVTAGPRIVYVEEGDQVLLVDPDETVHDSAITASEGIIVRRTTITRRQPFRSQSYEVDEVMEALDIDELHLDSANIDRWTRDNRWLIVGVVSLFFGLTTLLDWLVLPLYALVVGAVLSGLFGFSKLPLATSFPLLLAVAVPTVVMRWLLWVLGVDTSCVGLLVWPIVMAAMGAPLCVLAVSRARRSSAP